MVHTFEVDLNGRKITLETGKMAKQANGAVVVRSGDSVVLVTACANADPKPGAAFFPLTVDYREYTYAAGKIPGGFIKREGRMSEKETLTSRLIDRPVRPLFPEGFSCETQNIAMVVSADPEQDPDKLAIVGAGAALAISDIPFGHDCCRKIAAGIKQMVAACGKTKRVYTPPAINKELYDLISSRSKAALKDALNTKKYPKLDSYSKVAELKKQVVEALPEEQRPEGGKVFNILKEEIFRDEMLNERRRPDGRAFDEIRNITIETGLLPRTHGSALFTRGETQALVTVTLGTKDDEQRIELLEPGESPSKRFMLHYNFPPFSVGEVGFMRGAGRREIGHGALAERSMIRVLPDEAKFPYTLRVVSDILESNGSSSMATICGATLALMDAGVPIAAPVSGVAMGMVK